MKNQLTLVLLLIGAMLYSFEVRPQQVVKKAPLERIEERMQMPYHPNVFQNQRTTPAYRSFRATRTMATTITTSQVNVDSAGNNIVNDAANEPSLAVAPANPTKMAIGWRQFDDISSDFRQAGWAYTNNGGSTWSFPGRIQTGVFRSDPVLDYDNQGNFYYNSLDYNFYCRVFKSSDGGATWDAGTDAAGGDKQWMVIDRNGGNSEGFIYSAWSSYATTCGTQNFTRSTDFNVSYDSCSDVDGDPHFGTMAIDLSGNVYVAGWNYDSSIAVVARSYNADSVGSTATWQSVQVNMGGYMGTAVLLNPAGLMGQVNVEVDRSGIGTGTNGNIYLLATLVDSAVTTSDVMFTRSTDGGITWSSPIIINDDVDSAIQWMGTMSVAPNGRIDAVWLDTRDANGSDSSALYYSYSVDGGLTWSVNEMLSGLFDPHAGYPQQPKMGDYFDMISDNNGAHLAWAGTFNGEQDVYYSRIQPNLASFIPAVAKQNVSISPNPVTDLLTIRGLSQDTKLRITNATGALVYSAVVQNETEFVDLSFLPAGIYVASFLYKDGSCTVRKLVKN